MARLTVLDAKVDLREDCAIVGDRYVLPWEYPHDVELVAPCRRTFLVDCRYVDRDDLGSWFVTKSETRAVALDLPWHVVGPKVRGEAYYASCLLLGFDSDPRGAKRADARGFPVNTFGALHHCLGAKQSDDVSFWNTTFVAREYVRESPAPGSIIAVSLVQLREWVSVWVDRPSHIGVRVTL